MRSSTFKNAQLGMHFDAEKCKIMAISQSIPVHKIHQLDNTNLVKVSVCTYVRAMISKSLGLEEHMDTIVSKANSRLRILSRKTNGYLQVLRRMSCISRVHLTLDYRAGIWNPHLGKHKDSLEHQQAFRWIKAKLLWVYGATAEKY